MLSATRAPSSSTLPPYTDEEPPLVAVDMPSPAREADAEFGGLWERAKLEKALLRKLDARMSILVLIYIMNFVDRTNAAAARLRGFEADLGLQGQQFATLLSILYVGYICMQIPSNMFLNYTGKPSLYLPAAMSLWGGLTIATGFTRNFTGVLITRFFLGFVEAAFFPGALFLLSSWYRREELGLRMAIFYCGSLISNAFGGLIAAGILDTMDGKLGYAAWRWLFIIEGSVTIFVAICSIFILPDFPSNTQWLLPLERRLAEVRIAEDVGNFDNLGEKKSQIQGLRLAVGDWKVWWLAVNMAAFMIALSFFAYFPTLTATLGYSRTVTLLLCAPPWVFATAIAFINARHSDKVRERFFHVVVPVLFGILGLAIALSTMNTAARYIALFLMAQSNAGYVVFLSWVSNSIPNPPAKRAVALALINMVAQLGNVAGSYVFPGSWGPTYRKSYTICIVNFAVSIIMSLVFRRYLISINRRKDQNENLEDEDAMSGSGPSRNSVAGGVAVEGGVEQLGKAGRLKRLTNLDDAKDNMQPRDFRFVY
ncbi:hypothetical protein BOTBODRAFT_37405 [Botryobasidium botryosum FD-172 SS1]|uniref:Major facilitator superfamily (MFS) profile domain-containing protein n=1 Tax=Botryobasidium botryosum (strain FD-172 SS1) TaxID=930990 RepID=A0A067MAW8_BOTB1|nr:hypothetical protein BOTBODRAFT_37405 [Botryobasidium botryosum FD-172 SS1]